ncbi:hypothetical protein [Streptomyces sp. NPDC002172]
MDDEPQPVILTATCHTSGCTMAEVPNPAPFYPNADAPTFRGMCGQCGETVTDIVPLADTAS